MVKLKMHWNWVDYLSVVLGNVAIGTGFYYYDQLPQSFGNRTHRFAPIWMISGLLFFLSAFLPTVATIIIFVLGITACVLIPVVYSYALFVRKR